MLEINSIRCWLRHQINNNKLPEYNVQVINETTIRAYISSEDGLEFSIRALLPKDSPLLVPHVYHDDQKLNALVVEKDSNPLSIRIMGLYNSASAFLPFVFGMNEIDPGML